MGEGIFVGVVAVFVAIVVAGTAYRVGQVDVAEDCVAMGKTKIAGTAYLCAAEKK